MGWPTDLSPASSESHLSVLPKLLKSYHKTHAREDILGKILFPHLLCVWPRLIFFHGKRSHEDNLPKPAGIFPLHIFILQCAQNWTQPPFINNTSIRDTFWCRRFFKNHYLPADKKTSISFSDKITQWTVKIFKSVGGNRSFCKNMDSQFFYDKVLPEALSHLNQKAASYSLEFQLQTVRCHTINMILLV